MVNKPDLFDAWHVLAKQIRSLGLEISRGYDFDLLGTLSDVSGLKPLERHFCPTLNTFTHAQAFWLCLVDSKGHVVARVAARLDRLGDMSLTDFWRKYWRRCYPNALGEDNVRLAAEQPGFAQSISGDVAYFGGLIVHSNWRSKGLGGLLTRLAHLDAYEEWAPNFFYSWIEPLSEAKLVSACQFTRVHRAGLRWDGPGPAKLDPDLIFVGLSKTDLADQIRQICDGRGVPLSGKTADETPAVSETVK